MRRIRATAIGATLVGLLAALTAPTSGTSAAPVVAEVPLPLTGFSAIAADRADGAVFVSSATNSSVVRVGRDGTVRSLAVPRASGLAVVGPTLYVALPDHHAIAAVDTATFTERTRYATGPDTCPTHLAAAGATVWFGYGCGRSFGTAGLGALDTAAPSPVAVTGRHGDLSLLGAPLVAARAGGPVVIGERNSSGLQLHVFDVTPTGTALRVSNEPGALGGDTTHFTLTPDGRRVLLASLTPDYVQVLTADELKLAGVHDAGPRAYAVAVSPDGQRVAATVSDSVNGNSLLLFAAGRATPRERVAIADVPTQRGLTWSPDGTRLYHVTGRYDPPGVTLRVVQTQAQRQRPDFGTTGPGSGRPTRRS